MDEANVRVFGYCENCGSEVTDEHDTYYILDDGTIFCCDDCLCEHFSITKIEV